MARSRWLFAHRRRMSLRCLAGGAMFAIWLTAIDSARGRDPGRGPPTDTGPPASTADGRPDSKINPPAVQPASATRPAPLSKPLEVDLWHQNLIRDRQVEMRLRTAQKDIAGGRLIGALTNLQSIIESDEDIFLRIDSEPIPGGAHTLATRILDTLPATALENYESLFGSQARQQLAEMTTPDPKVLGRIVRQFYHTAAGFESGNRLATYWSERGHDELAWTWWQRVIRAGPHAQRLLPVHRLQAAACCRHLGCLSQYSTWLADLTSDESIRIGGRQTTIRAACEDLLRRPLDAALPAAAQMRRGRGGHNAASPGTPLAPTRMLWRGSLAGPQSQHLENLAHGWESHQLLNGLPIGTSQSPLLIGDRLVYRDFEGIRAVDARTGQTHWYVPCVSSVGREISARQTIPADGNPDPNNVMRLIVGNAGVQNLATDGQLVFAIDCIETEDMAPTGSPAGDAATPVRRQCNVLAAFDLIGSSTTPVARWSVGGRAEESALALKGHFFLGAPVAVADRLFVISEFRQQLCLSCLAASSGNVIWMQTICSVSQSISSDPQRAGLACSPSYGAGIVVCPTQAGVLVAVDALTGTLLWAASHDEGESQQRQQMSAWLNPSRRPCAPAAYVNLPVIHDSRVFYLPAHSEYVHCVDLPTGRLNWRSRREDLESATATEYVATVSDATVLVVGRRRCRGLDIETGAERWGVRLGSSPTGRGVRLAAQYHVPLDDGTIIGLEIDTGRLARTQRGSNRKALGNLVAGRDVIASLGPAEIAVFPQADAELSRLQAMVRDIGNDHNLLLDIAELELILDRLDSAERRLEELSKRTLEPQEADRATALLREVLHRQLVAGAVPMGDQLARLGGLSRSPEHYADYLRARRRARFDGDELAVMLAAVRDGTEQSEDRPYIVGDDPSRKVAGLVLAAGELQNLGMGNMPAVQGIEADLSAAIDQAVQNRDVAALRRWTMLLTDQTQADAARIQLAQLLMAANCFQQAETVLLACRESPQQAAAGHATRMLAELWSGQGLCHDAARMFGELSGRYAEIEVADRQCGAAWLAARSRDDPTWEAYRKLARASWSGTGVKIVEHRAASESLQTAYNGNGVLLLTTPRQSLFDLLDRGRGANGLFAVVNRHTGAEYPETILAPGRFFYPVGTHVSGQYLQHSYVGNFFPLGGVGVVHGVSLLERKLLWTTAPPAVKDLREVVRVGPAGPGFCTFQLRQHLFVLDPLDGRLLWHRDDLEGSAGLMHEPFLGIIGDERILTVFATNGTNYTVYDTATGAELRRGKVDVQTRLPRRVVGRRLFHYTAAPQNRRVRVWDPLTDDCTWDESADSIAEASNLEGLAAGTKMFAFVRETNEAAYLTIAGTIRVVNLLQGQAVCEIPISQEYLENASVLRVFRDHERYYFNVQRSTPPGKPPAPASVSMAVTDAILPTALVEGDLLAVDRQSREILWHRPLGKRSILQLPDLSLPVLVSLSRTRRDDTSYLAVEVIDVLTGEMLAVRQDLQTDRLLQAAYDQQAPSIELRGAKTVIRLEFASGLARSESGGPK